MPNENTPSVKVECPHCHRCFKADAEIRYQRGFEGLQPNPVEPNPEEAPNEEPKEVRVLRTCTHCGREVSVIVPVVPMWMVLVLD